MGQLLRLQKAVMADVPAGYVMAKSEAELGSYLQGQHGAAFGVEEEGTLIAMTLLSIPNEARPNAGPFPRVPKEDWALHACFVQHTMVTPHARGRGLQRQLFDLQRDHAMRVGMRWMCSGMHFTNEISWRNRMANGLMIVGMRLDLGHPIIGMTRGLGARELKPEAADERVVPAQDASAHKAALLDGYVGVQMRAAGEVIYRRLRIPANGPFVITEQRELAGGE